MSQFIAIPLKKTSEVDLAKPMQQFISTYYQNDQKLNEAAARLDKLRKEATFKGIEGKSTTTLSALQRYYDQLNSITTKCPTNEVPINFKWKDAFEKPGYSLLSSSSSLTLQSLAYERVCVLFNLAASYSDVAATILNEDVHNEHALQLAAKYFQLASSIFASLKSDAPAALGQRSSHTDSNPTILDILHYLMLAQAQESIFVKAVQNNMSDSSLSKLASQCSDYYAECYKLIQIVKSIWPDESWFNQIYSKQFCYSGISDYHQAIVAGRASKFGEEIAWLVHSLESFKQGESKAPLPEYLQTYQKKAIRRHENAVKENDFIYHARVPEYRLLDSVERYSLVKPTPIPNRFSSESGDLLDGLTPKSSSDSDQNRTPASPVAPVAELPQSLKDKSKYIRQMGGIAHVRKLVSELPVLLQRNLEILDEIAQSLRTEESRDDAQRQKFGRDKWIRAPSQTLNRAWKDHVEKYRNIIKNAMDADERVKDKFKNHEREIAFLDQDLCHASLALGPDMSFSRLEAAHDAFNDLLRHLQEGTKFYNDLTQLLVTLQTQVNDFCYARKAELENIVRTLDSTLG